MLKKIAGCVLVAGAVLFGLAGTASAQQTLNITFGYAMPNGEDARADDDILTTNRTFLAFDIEDFNSGTVGAEWLVGLGNYLEAGAGLSFARRTVPSVYDDFVDIDGSEIEQEIRLRRIPMDFTVRIVPTGQGSPIQPYVGAGLSVVSWRYSESGEFIDFAAGNEIFRETYADSGTATGAVILGGLRFVGDQLSGGFEFRYLKATADLATDDFGSALNPNPVIDLGGWTYQGTIGFRFGR